MRTRIILPFLVLLLALQGCVGGRNSDRLNGQWVCDARATIELTAESKGMSETQFKAASDVLESMFLNIDGKTKTLVLRVGQSTETSPFTVSVQGRNSFLLELTGATASIELKGRDTLWLTDSRTPGRTVVFTRVK